MGRWPHGYGLALLRPGQGWGVWLAHPKPKPKPEPEPEPEPKPKPKPKPEPKPKPKPKPKPNQAPPRTSSTRTSARCCARQQSARVLTPQPSMA